MSVLDTKPQRIITYEPDGPVLKEFLNDDSFVRGILGPIGSGKSAGCAVEVLKRSADQYISPSGVKKSRWAVIRNSYPELKTTTLKTWFEWCPQEYGKFTQDSPIIHHVKMGNLDMEVLFMALDRPEDVKKLLSLELTGAWLNEAREIEKSILDALTGRVGRYPSRKDGGCKWSGIFMDTNPPDDQSWWYKFSEGDTPKGFRFFRQPAGDSEEGENKKNLPANYYERIKAGKDDDWIKVYVKAEYGFVTEGKAVYPMFRDRIHVASSKIVAAKGIPLMIGADFGLTPAAVIAQFLVDGRWLIIDEVTMQDCGNVRFAEYLKAYVAQQYPDHYAITYKGRGGEKVEMNDLIAGGWGDPAGNQRASSDERTALEIMKTYTGWVWKPAPTNDMAMRREVVIGALSRLVDGNPGILISPTCEKLRKGFSGGYHFKYVKTGNGTQTHESPAKNEYSHIHDALQYLLLGGGESSVVLGKKKVTRNKNEVRIAQDLDYDMFARE